MKLESSDAPSPLSFSDSLSALSVFVTTLRADGQTGSAVTQCPFIQVILLSHLFSGKRSGLDIIIGLLK